MVGHAPSPEVAKKFVQLVGAGASTGPLAARNIAEKSAAFSKSLTETAPRVLSLQRDWLRSVPWIKRAYSIRYSESKMRSAITAAFKEKKDGQDVHTINRLILMGRMELEETLMLWKGQSHVTNWFEGSVEKAKVAAKPKPGFLDNFFAGK